MRQVDAQRAETVLQAFFKNNPSPDEGSASTSMLAWDKFHSAGRRDPFEALEALAAVEESEINFSARSSLVNSLSGNQFPEQAYLLWDETLNHLADLGPGQISAISNIANTTFRLHPERLSEVLEVWGELVATADQTQVVARMCGPGSGTDFEEALNHLEWTALATLRAWLRTRPTLAHEALEYFPELQGKLETIGGLSGYARRQRERHRQQRTENERRILDTYEVLAGESGLRQEILQGPGEITRLIGQASTFYDNPLYDEEQGARALEIAAASISQLDDNVAITLFRQLVVAYMGNEGRVPERIRREALGLVERSRRETVVEVQRPRLTPEGIYNTIFPDDELEAVLLASLAWEDFQRAEKRIQELPDYQRMQAYFRYARWVGRQGHGVNRNRFN